MRLRIISVLICTLWIVNSSPVVAESCAYRDGGYCIDRLLGKTITAIENSSNKKVATFSKTKGKQGFGKYEGQIITKSSVGNGTFFYMYYETLWNWLVKSGILNNQNRQQVFVEASKAGGTKTGGVNLVVLGAGTLQQLVEKGFITTEQAQSILNQSKQK